MTQYDNTNRGAAFLNEKRATDNHPDYRGSINVEGKDFWISFWFKTPKAGGNEFLSYSIQPKDEQQEKPAPQQQASRSRKVAAQEYSKASSGGKFDEMDDDIPF